MITHKIQRHCPINQLYVFCSTLIHFYDLQFFHWQGTRETQGHIMGIMCKPTNWLYVL